MPDESVVNTIAAEGGGRSILAGDVPEYIRRRYYRDDRGGSGLGFYVDARVQAPAFRDRGGRLVAARSDPNTIRDMAAIAQHRGWTAITVRGDADFRREAWLTAMSLGIEVRGYTPSPRDSQNLDRRQAAQARRASRTADQRLEHGGHRAHDSAAAGRSNMRIVEAVVRARVSDRPAQDRILAAARERLAFWLEQGARLRPIEVARSPGQQEAHRSRERQRGR